MIDFVGSSTSAYGFAHYENVEHRHTFFTSVLIKGAYLSTVLSYSSYALYPISYAIFNYPEPDNWLLPTGFNCLLFEEIPNRTVRFFADWFIQLSLSIVCFIIAITIVSFYVGFCSYVEAMVKDLQQQLKHSDEFGEHTKSNRFIQIGFRWIYLDETLFHKDILE